RRGAPVPGRRRRRARASPDAGLGPACARRRCRRQGRRRRLRRRLGMAGHAPARPCRPSGEAALTVSVIVKTLNEEAKIAATVGRALDAIAGIGGQVVVADSGSRARTLAIAAGYPVTIARIEPPALPSCGIGPQLGYQYSRHPFLCLIDGDMVLDPDFLGPA